MSCLQYHEEGRLLCGGCLKTLPWMHHACQRCAYPLGSTASFCGHCMNFMPDYVQARALFIYKDPIARMIHDLKYNKKLYWASFFGQLIAEALPQGARPQAVIPMPTTRTALIKRGFNPAMEIAKGLSLSLDVPILWRPFEVTSKQRSQSTLSKKDRLSNVKHVFKIHKPLLLKDVLVIDDVMTTGATLCSFAKALREKGVQNIHAFLVARTPIGK